MGLEFVDGLSRPMRDNAIDVYISDEYMDVLGDDVWAQTFKVRPEPLTTEEKKAWIATQSQVTVGSDAFFPFGDNVERARKSGVEYIVQPGGSIRDDNVIGNLQQVRNCHGLYRLQTIPPLRRKIMNVLVIGSGGREHAIVKAIHDNPRIDRLYCAPGNGRHCRMCRVCAYQGNRC